MPDHAAAEVTAFMKGLTERNPGEPEFHQAVQELVESVMPLVLEREAYRRQRILDRVTEPDRTITFRVGWEDDRGELHINRAWRVQFNNAIGPYKGGLRFDPELGLGTLKFLGFEQTFKNSLTTLPMGGAKGGANFDPKGKSDREVMRFCQSMMIELRRYIGEDTDVPAGDIGVGAREISFLFGQYKRIENRWSGAMTGKGLAYGGSLIRTEATGYGVVYFAQNMLEHHGESLAGKTCTVSGSGNVALYTIEKLLQVGAKVVTASDSGGFVHDPRGFDPKKLAFLKDLKEVRRGRIAEYAKKFGLEFYAERRPWGVPCQAAFPCARQMEISAEDAATLLENGVRIVVEGSNMPTELEGMRAFVAAKTLYAPAKAANAGGVAVSGLEQSQNSQRLSWTREEVDARLQAIMRKIHAQCVEYGTEGDSVNYVHGANRAGFVKVADAMVAFGNV